LEQGGTDRFPRCSPDWPRTTKTSPKGAEVVVFVGGGEGPSGRRGKTQTRVHGGSSRDPGGNRPQGLPSFEGAPSASDWAFPVKRIRQGDPTWSKVAAFRAFSPGGFGCFPGIFRAVPPHVGWGGAKNLHAWRKVGKGWVGAGPGGRQFFFFPATKKRPSKLPGNSRVGGLIFPRRGKDKFRAQAVRAGGSSQARLRESGEGGGGLSIGSHSPSSSPSHIGSSIPGRLINEVLGGGGDVDGGSSRTTRGIGTLGLVVTQREWGFFAHARSRKPR